MTRDEDIKITQWAYEIFDRVVPEEHRQCPFILGAKYADDNPSEDTVNKISTLKDKWNNDEKNQKKYSTFYNYVRAHWREV